MGSFITACLQGKHRYVILKQTNLTAAEFIYHASHLSYCYLLALSLHWIHVKENVFKLSSVNVISSFLTSFPEGPFSICSGVFMRKTGSSAADGVFPVMNVICGITLKLCNYKSAWSRSWKLVVASLLQLIYSANNNNIPFTMQNIEEIESCFCLPRSEKQVPLWFLNTPKMISTVNILLLWLLWL